MQDIKNCLELKKNNPKSKDEVMKKINKQKVWIENQEWTNSLVEELSNVKNWNTQSVKLGFNKKPTIIRDIIEVNFLKLKRLNLDGNFIQTVEVLQRMNSPDLYFLQLNNNRICCITSLRKMKCPFENISLINNKLQDIQCLNKINFSNVNMKKIINPYHRLYGVQLQWDQSKKNEPVSNDNRWALKMNIPCKINVKGWKRNQLNDVVGRKQESNSELFLFRI